MLSQAASLEGPEPDQPATIPEESATVPQEAAGIHSRVFSRVGLLGNPSDGFGGRCISFSLANFSAEVHQRLATSRRLLMRDFLMLSIKQFAITVPCCMDP